jgi:hypothetical protein
MFLPNKYKLCLIEAVTFRENEFLFRHTESLSVRREHLRRLRRRRQDLTNSHVSLGYCLFPPLRREPTARTRI